MIFRGAEPHVHLAVGVEVSVHQAEQASFIVVGAGDAFDQGRKIEGDQIHLDADLRKILLNHGGHLLAGFIAGAGDDREFDAIARGVSKHTAVEAEARASEEVKSGSGIVLRRGKLGIEPEMIGWGDGAVSGLGMAGVDDPGEVGAIDSQRDGLAKFGGAEPNLLVVRNSGGGNLVEPELFRVEAGAGVVCGGRRFFLEAVEEIGIERIDEMDFAAAEAKNFDVMIALNVQANGIKIREGLALLILFPVIRIAPEKDVGSGSVVGNIERAEDGHFLLLRMSGENRNLVEEAIESRYGGRKGHNRHVR